MQFLDQIDCPQNAVPIYDPLKQHWAGKTLGANPPIAVTVGDSITISLADAPVGSMLYRGPSGWEFVGTPGFVEVSGSGVDQIVPVERIIGPYSFTGETATTGGGVLATAISAQNFGFGQLQFLDNAPVIITEVILYVSTVSTGAATLDIGIAANGSTSDDTLIDGVDVHSATGVFSNKVNGGTNGLPYVLAAAGSHLTITGSADTTGLVGEIWIKYLVP